MDPPRCLIIVSRRKPIRDVLRRPLSGDSDGTDEAVGGPAPSLSFAGAGFDLFGDPADLAFVDPATTAAFLGSAATGGPAIATGFGSDVGNLEKNIHNII